VFSTETAIRLSCFAAVFLVVALAESLVPRRRHGAGKPIRWSSNLALAAINAVVVRVVLPIGAVGMAMLAEVHGWGLLNDFTLPRWVAVLVSVVLLDLVIYLQHVLFHAIPGLWRLHMVHHSDLEFDVTTGLRFHTLEILVSLGVKLVAILLFGPPAVAVLTFEILLNATSMFSHGNLRLPNWLDGLLRFFMVTPDMHRVHHSAIATETNSNFGFNLPWWDFLLGTYRAQPAQGHERMTIGLSEFRDNRVTWLHWMLALPFASERRKDRYDATTPGESHSDAQSTSRPIRPELGAGLH
jgi:sterol desaturase/sphingolipid hydroxylase (fatty acid hydroxylase superfamily)